MHARKDRASSKQNEQNIYLRETERHADRPRNRQDPAFHRRAAESPESLHDHGNHHRLDAVQQCRNGRQVPKAHVRPRNDSHQDCRRRNKARAADEQPRPAGPQVADVDSEFAGTRSGNQVAGAKEVKKFFAREPFPAANQFIFHDGNVRRRPAKRGDSQPQEKKRQFFQRSALGRVRCSCLGLFEIGQPHLALRSAPVCNFLGRFGV